MKKRVDYLSCIEGKGVWYAFGVLHKMPRYLSLNHKVSFGKWPPVTFHTVHFQYSASIFLEIKKQRKDINILEIKWGQFVIYLIKNRVRARQILLGRSDSFGYGYIWKCNEIQMSNRHIHIYIYQQHFMIIEFRN